jgi:hypothetical protein
VISSTQVTGARTYAPLGPTRTRRTHKKLALIASLSMCFIVLISFIVTHMGTYDVALPLSSPTDGSNRADVQPTATSTTDPPTVPIQHSTSYSVVGKPTITAPFIYQVLGYYHSPAQGDAQALYDLGGKYNIDPAFALAFFGHESTFGTSGEATASLSLGNLRCIGPGYEDLHPSCRDNYAWFSSWRDGFEAFYRLIAGSLYVGAGLVTPDQIVPRWAPPSDGNDDSAYINALKKSVDREHAGQVDIENF